MATFLELQNRVQTRIIDLPAPVLAEVPSLVNKAILRVQELHNFWVMEAEQDYVTTFETRQLGLLPSDFKEIRDLPQETPRFSRARHMAWAPSKRQAESGLGQTTDLDFGEPLALEVGPPSNVAGQRPVNVYPYPDGNSEYDDGEYRIRLYYWKFLPALSASGDTNWFTVHGEEYIENMATSMGFALDWDEIREAAWLAKAERSKADLIKLDKRQQIAQVDAMPFWPGYRTIRIGG